MGEEAWQGRVKVQNMQSCITNAIRWRLKKVNGSSFLLLLLRALFKHLLLLLLLLILPFFHSSIATKEFKALQKYLHKTLLHSFFAS